MKSQTEHIRRAERIVWRNNLNDKFSIRKSKAELLNSHFKAKNKWTSLHVHCIYLWMMHDYFHKRCTKGAKKGKEARIRVKWKWKASRQRRKDKSARGETDKENDETMDIACMCITLSACCFTNLSPLLSPLLLPSLLLPIHFLSSFFFPSLSLSFLLVVPIMLFCAVFVVFIWFASTYYWHVGTGNAVLWPLWGLRLTERWGLSDSKGPLVLYACPLKAASSLSPF